MIAHTSWVVTPRARPRLRGLGRIRGLGQDPYQQWVQSLPASCWLNNDPSSGQIICPAPASVLQATAALPIHQPSPEGFLPGTTTATAQNPTYSTQVTPGTAFTTTTFDLNSYMAKWATEAAAGPASLQGQDPVAAAIAVAQGYCATEGVAGCSDLVAIATSYGNQVKAAIAAAGGGATTTGTTYAQQNSGSSSKPASPGPGYVWDGTCWRPAAGGSCWNAPATTNQPPSPGPGYVWDGTTWRYAPSGGGSSTVVNPSPATQPTTDGSSLTSPASLLSLTNGASVQAGGTTTTSGDIIPGIPNAAIFLGGAAAVVLLVLGMQR